MIRRGSAVLVLLLSLLTTSAATASPQQPVDFGKVLIPSDFDQRTEVLLGGEYGVALFDDELVLVFRSPVDGLEHSYGLETKMETAADAVASPRVDVDRVEISGVPHVRLRARYGNTMATALLRVSDAGAARQVVRTPVDPAIEHEIALLREAHALLTRDASRIWPGWTDHASLEYVVSFPNRAVLILSGRNRVPQAFEELPLPTIAGKRLYLDRTAAVTGHIDRITGVSAHGDIAGITAELQGTIGTPGQPASGPSDSADEDDDVSDLGRVLTYVHEAFHCRQAAFALEREKTGTSVARPRGARNFEVNTDFATYAEVEGDALQRAVTARTPQAAAVFLRDAFLARQLKQRAMPAAAVITDTVRTRDEGTAVYAAIRAAILAQGEPHEPPKASADGWPQLRSLYRRLRQYVSRHTTGQMARVLRDSQSTTERFYVYGLYLAMALDRALPAWKAGFFQRDRTFDDVLAARFGLSPQVRARLERRLREVYRADTVRARHAATLGARARAIEAVRSRKGRVYRIDVSEAQPGFDIHPRGDAIFANREQIYPHGLERLDYGTLRLQSSDTPMRFERNVVEWVDTEPADGQRGYEVACGTRDGDVCREATVTTRGFSFTAGTVRVTETADAVTFFVVDR